MASTERLLPQNVKDPILSIRLVSEQKFVEMLVGCETSAYHIEMIQIQISLTAKCIYL